MNQSMNTCMCLLYTYVLSARCPYVHLLFAPHTHTIYAIHTLVQTSVTPRGYRLYEFHPLPGHYQQIQSSMIIIAHLISYVVHLSGSWGPAFLPVAIMLLQGMAGWSVFSRGRKHLGKVSGSSCSSRSGVRNGDTRTFPSTCAHRARWVTGSEPRSSRNFLLWIPLVQWRLWLMLLFIYCACSLGMRSGPFCYAPSRSIIWGASDFSIIDRMSRRSLIPPPGKKEKS